MPLMQQLDERAADGRLQADPAQAALARRLDALSAELAHYAKARPDRTLARLIGAKSPEPPRGLYICGKVGRGKTMLMDLFFDAAPIEPKMRVHFHAFMADVHARLHERRQRRGLAGDPIAQVAASVGEQARLLCFDEFSVRDIADAMILGRLFQALFAAGVVLVATSNVAPDDLYKDGLNRALFLPFIAMLRERLDVVALEGPSDYRLAKLAQARVYHWPDDAKAEAALDEAFLALTGQPRGAPLSLRHLGRALEVPQARAGVARFSFDALCRAPLAASDYLLIAQRFKTLILDHIPILEAQDRDAARRFVDLIDALYDAKTKLVASAAGAPEALFIGADAKSGNEFGRAISRLYEMRSADYLAAPQGAQLANATGDLGGLVET